jgi:hypothetical protein
MTPEYEVFRVAADFDPSDDSVRWDALPALTVGHYLWLDNGYEPKVEARVGYSDHYLYVRFEAFEKRVRIRNLDFQSSVYKDSCVEMFIDPFPDKELGYLNFETNAAGAMLLGFGPGRHDRKRVPPDDLAGFRIQGSVRGAWDGPIGADSWTVRYRVPQMLFKKCYGEVLRPGIAGKANFYKCGDETEVPHYGAWSPPRTPAPDFHRPEFFGTLVFSGRIADLAATPS